MSLIGRLLKANPSAQVSDMLTGYFVIPSAKGAFDPPQSGIAVFAGGTITESYNFATNGNGTSFGNHLNSRSYAGALASSTRAVFFGGYQGTQRTMEYVTIASAGNGTSFGNLVNQKYFAAGSGSETRGIISGGYPNTAYEYITIATTGNATAFGAAYDGNTKEACAAFSSTTRSIDFGGSNNSQDDTMRYVTIASTGSGTFFGNLTSGARYPGGGSSSTRGLRMGGRSGSSPTVASNIIDYVTIATTGNATDFGDLTVARFYNGGASNSIRCISYGGGNDTVMYKVVDAVTIATLGNAIDLGDNIADDQWHGCSNSHGGL